MDAKRAATDGMLDCLCDFLIAAGEGDLVKDLKDVDTDDVVEMLDSAIELVKTLEKLGNLEFAGLPLPLSIPRADKKEECKCGKGDCDTPKVSVKMVDPADADMIIKSFLRNI